MNLIMEVTSRNAAEVGAARRKVFGSDGGRIGRAPDCDWVLANPYVSRHHATVHCINRTFYIESTGENGVALNDVNATLARMERRPLKSGDRVFIDEFEISVVVSEAAMPSMARTAAAAAPLEPSAEDLDPLKGLVAAGPQAPAPRAEVAWNASSSLADHFVPPALTPRPVGAPTAPPPRIGPRALPVAEDWDQTGFDRSALKPVPAPTQPANPALYAVQTTPPAPPPATGQADLAGCLRQLGVDASSVPAESLSTLGTIVHSVLQGLIDVLRARAEFRSQFHLQDTRITATENNPLKFAINSQDALGSLFGPRNPGYMAPIQAFGDAFDEMRFHQLATLAGMRAGFESMLARFDPEALQERFDRHLKRAGFLPMAARFRYWELYADLFEELSADPNATFQRMFGEAFAVAYEKQLEALKVGRGRPAA
jgi:type VI secretion system protein ImpI